MEHTSDNDIQETTQIETQNKERKKQAPRAQDMYLENGKYNQRPNDPESFKLSYQTHDLEKFAML